MKYRIISNGTKYRVEELVKKGNFFFKDKWGLVLKCDIDMVKAGPILEYEDFSAYEFDTYIEAENEVHKWINYKLEQKLKTENSPWTVCKEFNATGQ